MTTLTINQDIKLNKSNFNDIDELLEYFILQNEGIMLLPLKAKEMTKNRMLDWDKVESINKKQFIEPS